MCLPGQLDFLDRRVPLVDLAQQFEDTCSLAICWRRRELEVDRASVGEDECGRAKNCVPLDCVLVAPPDLLKQARRRCQLHVRRQASQEDVGYLRYDDSFHSPIL